MSETKALLRRRGEGKEGDGTRSSDGDTKKCVGREGTKGVSDKKKKKKNLTVLEVFLLLTQLMLCCFLPLFTLHAADRLCCVPSPDQG